MKALKGVPPAVIVLIVAVFSILAFVLLSNKTEQLVDTALGPDPAKQVNANVPSSTESASDLQFKELLKANAQRAYDHYIAARSLGTDVDNWRVYNDTQCNVTYHLPPINDLFTKDKPVAYWDIPRGIYNSVFMMVAGLNTNKYKQISAAYSSFEETKQSTLVYVNCTKDKVDFTNLTDFIKNKAESYKVTGAGGVTANSVSNVVINPITKWGRNVLQVTWDQNYDNYLDPPFSKTKMFYLFEKEGRIYEVGGTVGDDANMLNDVKLIIDKLEF